MLSAFLWTLLALVVLLGGALALPVCFDFSVRLGQDSRYRIVARPLWGRGPRITLVDSRRPQRRTGKTRKAKTAPRRRRKSRTRPNSAIGLAIFELIGRLFACVRFDFLHVDGRFGTGDPAETGQLFGMAAPLIYNAGSMPRTLVSLRPVFDRACVSGIAKARLSVIPLTLLPPLVRFGWVAFGPAR